MWMLVSMVTASGEFGFCLIGSSCFSGRRKQKAAKERAGVAKVSPPAASP